MKKLLSLAVLASAMALTACGGGDSSSSGSSYTSAYAVTLGNGNQYNCPTATAQTACTSDSACSAATCSATKIVTPIVNPSTLPACQVSGSNIYGTKGSSCTFTISNLNGGATQVLACNASGAGSYGDGSFNFGTSSTINGITLSCK